MSELSGPLRSLFEKIAPPIDIRRVMAAGPARERRYRGWLVAVAAAAVVLVGGVGWLLWAWVDGRPPVTSEPTVTGWALVPADPASLGGPGRQEMGAVTPGGPGLVAVGTDCGESLCDGAVWVSADGLRWTRVEAPEGVFDGPGSQEIQDVILGGPGLVAVGHEHVSDTLESDALVWTSPDGLDWSRASGANPDLGGPGDQSMYAVVAGGPGLVAVGGDSPDAAVWTSPDGENWTQVPDPGSALGGPGQQLIFSVTSGGPGLVAVGMESSNLGEESAAAVWTSPDGVSWRRAPANQTALSGADWQMMNSVAATGAVLVAVGMSDGAQGGRVWTSPDGLTWITVPDQPAFLGRTPMMLGRVIAEAGGFVLLGVDLNVEDAGDAAMWTSPDGITWTRVADTFGDLGGPGFQMWASVAAIDSRLVAVGSDQYNGEVDAAVWYWPAERSERTDTRPPEITTPVMTTIGCPFRQSALSEQALPAAVAETRERIYQAAIDCDFQALSQVASEAGGIYYPDPDGLKQGNLPAWMEDQAWFVEIADALEAPNCVIAGGVEARPGEDPVVADYRWPAQAGGVCEEGFVVIIRDDGRWYAAADSALLGDQANP